MGETTELRAEKMPSWPGLAPSKMATLLATIAIANDPPKAAKESASAQDGGCAPRPSEPAAASVTAAPPASNTG